MSLEKGYVRIVLFALLLAIVMSSFKACKSYDTYHNKKSITYDSAANVLGNYLQDTLLHVDNVSKTLASDISKLRKPDAKAAASVLLRYQGIIDNDLLTWTTFDFVDKEGFVLATSNEGVLKKPIKILRSDRQWIDLSLKEPWKGHLSYLGKGNISGEDILPYGYGFTNIDNVYIGTISLGLNVGKLKLKLIEVLGDPQIKFLIFRKDKVNNKLELILNNINDHSLVNDDFKDLLDSSQGNVAIEMNDVIFKYIENNPISNFIIVIGQDKLLLDSDLSSYVYPRIEQNIILILFLALIYFLVKRKVVNPILSLSTLSKAIADGDKTVVIPRYDCEEIDYLAQQIKKIKKYIGIEERKEIAEKQNISKSAFLASVSHEIRSPISAIYSIGEILENKEGYDALSEANKIYFLREVKNQASESLDFIQDLLDVSQSESGNFKLGNLEYEDIEDLALKSIRVSKGSASRSSMQINFKSAGNLPKIKCDKRRIKQIFVNLLNNSIRYSPEGSKISIEIQKIKEVASGKKIRIILKDQGFGMTKSSIKKALKKHGIIKNINSDKIDSFGLGLPLVKYLIDQHDGSLNVFSEIGKGSKFIIEF